MWRRRQHLGAEPLGPQHRALAMARWAEIAPLARQRHPELLPAGVAAHPSEAMLLDAAIEKREHLAPSLPAALQTGKPSEAPQPCPEDDGLGTGEVGRFEGHTAWVTSVAFSPDGCPVLSGSSDNTIRLWDVGTRREVRRFTGHTRPVTSVCFSPDGRRILSAGSDKTVRQRITGSLLTALSFLPTGASFFPGAPMERSASGKLRAEKSRGERSRQTGSLFSQAEATRSYECGKCRDALSEVLRDNVFG